MYSFYFLTKPSWVLTEGSLWVNLVLYYSRWQRGEGEDRSDKTHVNCTLPFPLATYVKCDVTSANKEWGKKFSVPGKFAIYKKRQSVTDAVQWMSSLLGLHILHMFTGEVAHRQRATLCVLFIWSHEGLTLWMRVFYWSVRVKPRYIVTTSILSFCCPPYDWSKASSTSIRK